MLNAETWKPTSRFTGLAETYSRHRPGYPPAAIDYIMTRCGLQPGDLAVDVGCGTGISTRLLAERGLRAVGIEPNPDMRNRAAQTPFAPTAAMPEYRDGTAEATGCETGGAALGIAAQAFHWFDPEPTLKEFKRILRPNGWVVIMSNERDESDPFTAAFGSIVRTAPDADKVEKPRSLASDILLRHPLFHAGEKVQFPNRQVLDEQGAVGRAMSASYAPQEREAIERFTSAIREVFARFQKDGRVVLHYTTGLTAAQSKS